MKPRSPTTNRAAFTFGELMIILAVVMSVALVFLYAARPRRGCVYRMNCANNLKMTSLAFRQWALDNGDKFPTHVSVTNGGAMESVLQGEVWTAFLVMSNELNTPKVVFCPGETDRRRRVANAWLDGNASAYPGWKPTVFTNNINTTYFVGVDARDDKPQMLLIGDACLSFGKKPVQAGVRSFWTNSLVGWAKPPRTNHDRGGNIGLADGSVQSCDDKSLRLLLEQSGDATNRLAIP